MPKRALALPRMPLRITSAQSPSIMTVGYPGGHHIVAVEYDAASSQYTIANLSAYGSSMRVSEDAFLTGTINFAGKAYTLEPNWPSISVLGPNGHCL